MPEDTLDDIDISTIKDRDLQLLAVMVKSELRAQRAEIKSQRSLLDDIKQERIDCQIRDSATHKELYEKVGTVKEEVAKHGLIFGIVGSALVLITNFILGLFFRTGGR